MALYQDVFYGTTFYFSENQLQPTLLNQYQNVDNTFIVYWTFPQVPSNFNLYSWVVQTDTVDTFDSPNLKTYSQEILALREITGASTTLNSPRGIHVDQETGEIYITNFSDNNILVFETTDDGDIIPSRTITPNGFSIGDGLFVAGSKLYIPNGSRIDVIPKNSNGLTSPDVTITGGATQLSSATDIFVDTLHNEILVTNLGTNTVTVYPINATGNQIPIRTLDISLITTPLFGIFVDTVNNELFLTVASPGNSILVFPRTAQGTPTVASRQITGVTTQLNAPTGIYVDTNNNKVVVTNQSGAPSKILFFNRTADGNIAPTDIITTVGSPTDIFINAATNEAFFTQDSPSSSIVNSINLATKFIDGNVFKGFIISIPQRIDGEQQNLFWRVKGYGPQFDTDYVSSTLTVHEKFVKEVRERQFSHLASEVYIANEPASNIYKLLDSLSNEIDRLKFETILSKNDIFIEDTRDTNVDNFGDRYGVRRPDLMKFIHYREILKEFFLQLNFAGSLGSVRNSLNKVYGRYPLIINIRDIADAYLGDPSIVDDMYLPDDTFGQEVDAVFVWNATSLGYGVIIEIVNPLNLTGLTTMVNELLFSLVPAYVRVYVVGLS